MGEPAEPATVRREGSARFSSSLSARSECRRIELTDRTVVEVMTRLAAHLASAIVVVGGGRSVRSRLGRCRLLGGELLVNGFELSLQFPFAIDLALDERFHLLDL